MKKYDVKYFINKFEKIPDEEWCVGRYNGPNNTHCAHCAIGHCTKDYTNIHLRVIMEPLANSVTRINDGEAIEWYTKFESNELGDTPKERILNALYLINSGILEDV